MYCSGCGQALVAGQGFCPRCGLASGMAGYPGAPLPLVWLERRVNALAMAWLVYGALIALSGFAELAFAHAWMGGHGFGPWSGHGFGHRFGFWPGWPMIWPFAAGTVLLRAGLALAAGVGLLHKTPWGRGVAIVAGILALIHVPFGTGIGIWTLVVLLNAPNAAGYEVMCRE